MKRSVACVRTRLRFFFYLVSEMTDWWITVGEVVFGVLTESTIQEQQQ